MAKFKNIFWHTNVMRRTGMLLLITTIVVIVVLCFMFQHKPDWYQPVHLDAISQKQARKDAMNFVDSIGDRMVQGDSFEIVLDQHRLNQWLAMTSEFRSDTPRMDTERFADLAIQFIDNRIRLGALYQKGGLRAIVGATVFLSVGAEGQSVLMRLDSIHGGSLPAPRSVLKPLLESVLHTSKHSSSVDENPSIATVMLEKVETVDDLFEGFERRNRFVWPNGRRLFTFESIEIKEGEMRMRIRPLS